MQSQNVRLVRLFLVTSFFSFFSFYCSFAQVLDGSTLSTSPFPDRPFGEVPAFQKPLTLFDEDIKKQRYDVFSGPGGGGNVPSDTDNTDIPFDLGTSLLITLGLGFGLKACLKDYVKRKTLPNGL